MKSIYDAFHGSVFGSSPATRDDGSKTSPSDDAFHAIADLLFGISLAYALMDKIIKEEKLNGTDE